MPISDEEARRFLRDARALYRELDAAALEAENELLEAWRRGQADMMRKAERLIDEAPDFRSLSVSRRMDWYARNVQSINRAVEQSGYFEGAEVYLAKYTAWAELASRSLRLARVDTAFTEIPDELVRFLVEQDRDYFTFLNTRGRKELAKAFLDNALTGVVKSNTRETIRGMITGSYPWGTRRGLYEWHAGTYARTGHFRTFRIFQTNQAQAAGLSSYVYVGPLDGKTRPFCVRRVGNVYTATEIDAMDNQQAGAGDVLSAGGGWNCRHSWQPIGEALARRLREEGRGDRIDAMPAAAGGVEN